MACELTSEELINKVEKRKEFEKEQQHIGWYFWLVSELPVLVIGLCSILITAFAVVGIYCSPLPDFSDPSKGFEVRGTRLANKLVTWHKVVNETGYNLTLSNYPYAYLKRNAQIKANKMKRKRSRKKSKTKRSLPQSPLMYLQPNSTRTWDFKRDGYFCNNPKTKYAHWVFQLKEEEIMSMWSVDGLATVCQSQKQLLNHIKYRDVCIRQSLETCCPVMSLPNYVAYLADLQSCDNITQGSLNDVEKTLKACAPYYCQKSLKSNCWQSPSNNDNCPDVPENCTVYNAVYSIFHYFFEQTLICALPQKITLKRSAVFLPAIKHRNLLPIYYDNFRHPKRLDHIEIFAIDFGLKEKVFEQMLFADTQYPLCAMAAVGVVIFLYTKSLFVTIMNFISTLSAMLMSYFVYTIVFDFKYFPFINLAALLVMVGISADSVLVFFSAWTNYAADDERMLFQAKVKRHPLPLRVGVVLKATMKHVAWSLLVTGLTTAAAFFANFSSQVTAIKCFGVYTGLTVLTNLFLSLTWLPATIVLHHKYFNCSPCNFLNLTNFKCFLYWSKFKLCMSEAARVFFDQIQVLIIVRLRYIWTLLFTLLAIGGVYVVVVQPGLHLPATKTFFQYFKSSHAFEAYTNGELHDFAFQNNTMDYLPVKVIFGVWPTDMGDSRNPDDTGTLQFQRQFNVSLRSSQRWLLNFCKTMRNTTYFRPTDNQQHSHTMCFIEAFKEWMESKNCTALDQVCCKKRTFPYRPAVFNRCLKEAISWLNNKPGIRTHSWTSGPRFDKKDAIRSVILEFSSNVKFSASYDKIGQFYKDVNDFLMPHLDRAPSGLKNGWVISDLEFFALQKGLYDGTVASVGWSILVALVVILFTSRNLLISVFASATIAGIIFVTVASLVLMGWELNVLESVTISIAVGLSVDFTAHYAIAYIVATPRNDRQRRVEFSASRMGPPITLAALTTFLAGVGMVPAHVLAYTQFGVFLVLIMVASWLYSSYFFLSVLSIMGPQGKCCDVCCCICDANLDNEEHTTTMITESSVCTPSTSYHNDRSTAI